MENNEWKDLRKSIESEITPLSKEELNLMLESKTKQTVNKYIVILGVSVAVSAGLLIYLLITSLNRQDDLFFLLNNALLGILTLGSLISGLWSWYKLQNNLYDLPLKFWLEERIEFLSRWLNRKSAKWSLFLIPVLYVLIVLSVHVYFEHRLFVEVLQTEESLVGLIVGAVVGLTVSFYVFRKIRKYPLDNLEFLRRLYQKHCDV